MNNFIKRVVETYSIIHFPINVNGDETEMSFGCGLNDWRGSDHTQRPIEFFGAWAIIDQYLPSDNKVSFLEIGAARGLWAIAFIEWCIIKNKYPIYTTVTLMTDTNNGLNIPGPAWQNASLMKVKEFYKECCDWTLIDANSQLETTKNLVTKTLKEYDFVFIDADHEYEGVYKDIALYAPLAKKLLIFHDIAVPNYEHRVIKAIKEYKLKFDYEIFAPNSDQGIGIIKGPISLN